MDCRAEGHYHARQEQSAHAAAKHVTANFVGRFHSSTSLLRANPERSRFPVREESEVASLESPNGLGAAPEFQLRSEVSRTKFPAILPSPRFASAIQIIRPSDPKLTRSPNSNRLC